MFKKLILATTLAAFGAGIVAEAKTTPTVRDHTPRVKDRTPKVKLRGQRA